MGGGDQNWTNWQGNKIGLNVRAKNGPNEPQGGTKCLKYTKNVNMARDDVVNKFYQQCN